MEPMAAVWAARAFSSGCGALLVWRDRLNTYTKGVATVIDMALVITATIAISMMFELGLER
jgi:hypothetical protein